MILPNLRGYVLAGGESSRMQRCDLPPDKASLLWQGQTLLERAVALLQTVSETCDVLCGTAARGARLQLGGHGILDRFAGMGPAGGLEAALADAERQGASCVLVVPVDLPALTPGLLSAFASRHLISDASVTCMQTAGRPQPLPLLVRVSTLPFIQEALLAGDRKLLPLLIRIAKQDGEQGRLLCVEAKELYYEEDGADPFLNVNTPDDFLLLQQNGTSTARAHQNTNGT